MGKYAFYINVGDMDRTSAERYAERIRPKLQAREQDFVVPIREGENRIEYFPDDNKHVIVNVNINIDPKLKTAWETAQYVKDVMKNLEG